MKRFYFALLAGALCAALVVHAQVYKWIDKDGKVQYTDQPPPPGASKADAQKVITTRPADSTAPADKPLKEKLKDSDKKKTEEAEKQKKDEETAKRAAQEKERCNEATAYLRALQNGERIARNDANGERFFLEGEKRDAEIARAQQVVSESCK
jgi:hypothetical protein